MSTKEDIITALQHCIPFDELPEEAITRSAKFCSTKSFKQKDTIFFEGDSGEFGYYVLSGRVSLRKTSPNGKELILAVLQQYEPFAVLAVIDKRPLPLTAIAQIDTELLLVPASVLSDIFTCYPEGNRRLLDMVGQRLRDSHELARALAHDRIEIRLAAALLMLSAGVAKGETLHVTRRELADLTGVTLETAVRTVKSLEQQGMLALPSPGQIQVLSPEELKELTEAF